MNRTSTFKVIALIIFTAFSLWVDVLFLIDKNRNAAQTAEIASLKAIVAKQQVEIQKANATATDSELKRAQFAAKAKAMRQSLLETRNAAAASTPAVVGPALGTADSSGDKKADKSGPFGSFKDSIAKMMKDPAMKDMMRTTQSAALRQMYGDLVKQWSLSPDETNTFYDALLDKQMSSMDQGMALLENGSGAAGQPPVSDPDAKLKATLGDDLYKQYQDYEKTIPARLTVSQLQQQLAAGSSPALTADQSAVLLQTVMEEQAAQPPGSAFPMSGTGGNSFAMDSAHVDQMMNAQSDLNDRIDARMANTLSPDQLQVLKQEQQQMLATQKMGMEMAAKMMGPSPTP